LPSSKCGRQPAQKIVVIGRCCAMALVRAWPGSAISNVNLPPTTLI
jgi:hypothetical protein